MSQPAAILRWLMTRVTGDHLLDYGTFGGELASQLVRTGKQVTIWVADEQVTHEVKQQAEQTAVQTGTLQKENEGEAPGRLAIYRGAFSPLFFMDGYFQTIIYHPGNHPIEDRPYSELAGEWERLLSANGRLLIVCPLTGEPDKAAQHFFTCTLLLQELERRLYLKEVEVRGGYLRAVAIKRYRERSRIKAVEWRELLEAMMHLHPLQAWQAERDHLVQEVNRLQAEKKMLISRLKQIESSLVYKAARRLRAIKTEPHQEAGHVKSSLNEKAETVSAPAVRLPLTGEDSDGIEREAELTEKAALQVREKELVTAWQRYVNQLRSSGAERWVMIYMSPTFYQATPYERTLQLANALLTEGVPVVLICDNREQKPVLPINQDELLFELPRDVFEKRPHDWLLTDPGIPHRVLFITQPELAGAKVASLAKLGNWQIVYDVDRDWGAMSRWDKPPTYSSAVENYILHQADVVTALTPALQAQLQKRNPGGDVLFFPNHWPGVRDWISGSATGERVATASAPSTEPVIIGYWGPLYKPWFDWDIVLQLAEHRPEWRWELIQWDDEPGTDQEAGFFRTRSEMNRSPRNTTDFPPANVRIHTYQDEVQAMRLISRWKAALLPYADPEVARSSEPLKLWRLLHMGVPVVFRHADRPERAPFLYVAEDQQSLLSRLEEAVGQTTTVEQFRQFVAQEGHSLNFEALWQALDSNASSLWSIFTGDRGSS